MTIYDVVKKLIGSIEPYGATHIDEQRKENLHEHIELLDELLDDLIKASNYRYRTEHSMKALGILAYDALVEFKENIEEIIDEI